MHRLLPFVLLGACSPSASDFSFSPPAPPAGAFQVVLPVVRDIPPGSDIEMCTWTDQIPVENLDLRAVEGHQSAGGHHVIVYASSFRRTPGTTAPCTNEDMVALRFVAGSGGEGQTAKNEAPAGLAYRVPAGNQIVLNHHYLNATNQTITAQSAMTFYPADPTKPYIPSASLVVTDIGFSIPARTPSYDIDVHCVLQKSMDGWFAIPHMHSWGKRITVDWEHAGSNFRVFDVPWQPEYQFQPPQIRKDDLADSLHFAKGDTLHVRCEWENESDKAIGFGMEMCVFLVSTIDRDGTGNLACNAGAWGKF